MMMASERHEQVGPVDAATLIEGALAYAGRGEQDRAGWVCTGLNDFDRRCGGLAPGTLMVIGGRPGMGRSALARTIAAHLIVTDPPGGVLVHVPAEDPQSVVLDFLSLIGKVNRSSLRTGMLDAEHVPHVEAAAEHLGRPGSLFIADAHEYSVASLRSQAEEMRLAGVPIRLVIAERVDQMLVSDDHDEREREMTRVVRELKQLAHDLHVPVVALLTTSAEAEYRQPPRPRILDLTAGAVVERHADMVVFVYRPDYYLREDTPVEWQGKAEVTVASFPGGEPGSMILGYLERYGRFVNLVPRPGSRRGQKRE